MSGILLFTMIYMTWCYFVTLFCFHFGFFLLAQLTIRLTVTMKALGLKGQSISVELIPMQLHYIFLQELLIYNRNQLEPICITDFNFRSARNYSENRGFEYIGIIVEGTCEVHFEWNLRPDIHALGQNRAIFWWERCALPSLLYHFLFRLVLFPFGSRW